jgi:hypothetical protein
VLHGGADVQGIDRSSAGRNASKDDPFWLRCRGRRMHEDRRICGARFGYSLASRQELEDGGESASPFKTYCGRPPQLAASFMRNVYASAPIQTFDIGPPDRMGRKFGIPNTSFDENMNGSAQRSFGGGTTKPLYTVGRVRETIEIEGGIRPTARRLCARWFSTGRFVLRRP